MDVFEAIGTAIAMRWFTPEPVPDDAIQRVLWAATRASNPGNCQLWDFIVVQLPAQRERIAEAVRASTATARNEIELPEDATARRILTGALNLVEHLGEIPVLIFVCGSNVYPPEAPREELMLSALHAAAQNLLVAARALGLGSAFTTLHQVAEPSIREILELPADRAIAVTIPLGWPARRFRPMSRKPLESVVHFDRW